jgi:hypothetical protein
VRTLHLPRGAPGSYLLGRSWTQEGIFMKRNSVSLFAFGIAITALWTMFVAGTIGVFEGYPLALRQPAVAPAAVTLTL